MDFIITITAAIVLGTFAYLMFLWVINGFSFQDTEDVETGLAGISDPKLQEVAWDLDMDRPRSTSVKMLMHKMKNFKSRNAKHGDFEYMFLDRKKP